VGGCFGCLENPQNYVEALSPVQCPEEPITSTLQCCTAARPTVNNQVGICGCDATAFPSGREFYLADKLLTVKNAWTTACTGQGTGCQGKCASVNFQSTHWWSAGAAIKFKGNTCPSGCVGPPATTTTPTPAPTTAATATTPAPAPTTAAPSGCKLKSYWEGKLKSAGIGQADIDKVCHNDEDSQWYYNGEGTKVGYGKWNKPCDNKKLKCRLPGGESFNGYSDQQAAWVKKAIKELASAKEPGAGVLISNEGKRYPQAKPWKIGSVWVYGAYESGWFKMVSVDKDGKKIETRHSKTFLKDSMSSTELAAVWNAANKGGDYTVEVS
jgi:hypothetical protein